MGGMGIASSEITGATEVNPPRSHWERDTTSEAEPPTERMGRCSLTRLERVHQSSQSLCTRA